MRPEPIRLHPPIPMPLEDFAQLLRVAERVSREEVREARVQGYAAGYADGLLDGRSQGYTEGMRDGRARERRSRDLATANGFVLGIFGTLFVLLIVLVIRAAGGG